MNSEMTRLEEEIKAVNKSVSYLDDVQKLELIVQGIKGMLKSLKSLSKKLEKRRTKIKKNCKHDFEYACSGHNSSIYECTECGELEDK